MLSDERRNDRYHGGHAQPGRNAQHIDGRQTTQRWYKQEQQAHNITDHAGHKDARAPHAVRDRSPQGGAYQHTGCISATQEPDMPRHLNGIGLRHLLRQPGR